MAEETIIIETSELKAKVKKSLASLGKRGTDRQGNTLFVSTTLSSAEENLIDRYISEGTNVMLGELSPLVEGYTNESSISVELRLTRCSSGKKNAFVGNMKDFVVSYAINKALGLSGNVEAQKNCETDMQRHLQAAVKLVFSKDAPESSGKKLSDMQGGISFENIEDNVQLI